MPGDEWPQTSAPGWGCSGGGTFGKMGISLSSPPPCLQGDPGKPGDPGRDVSTSGEGGFRLCSYWDHQAFKGPVSCPMLLGPGQCSKTLPCPQQSGTASHTPCSQGWLWQMGALLPCAPTISFPYRGCLGCVGSRDHLAPWVPWDHLACL